MGRATTFLAGVIASAGVILMACADDDGKRRGLSTADFAAFQQLVTAAADIDYEPLGSPVDAVLQSDAIVVGEVVGATVGRSLADGASDRETRYIILTVAVRTVLAGALPEPAGEVVYVALRSAGIDPAREIEEAAPKTRTLLVLDDWRPSGRVEGFPEQVYVPFTDGAWFETVDGVEGLWVERGEVEQRWGESIESLDDLAGMIEAAANQ